MALQNFVDKVGPVISAAYLNALDIIKETILENPTTKAQARTNLTNDAALEIANGGTGVRTNQAIRQAIGDELPTVGGTGNAITLTPAVAATSYYAGQKFKFIATNANSGAVTVAVSGLAAKALTKENVVALVTGDILVGYLYDITYDGTRFTLSAIPVSLPAGILTTSTGLAQGLTTIPIMSAAMTPSAASGAGSSTVTTGTNLQTYKTLDFDQTNQEFAHFQVPFPKNWNEGTITFQPLWSANAGTPGQGVMWALEAVAVGDDDAIDVAWGTSQSSADTYIAAGDVHVGPTSAAITIGGTPQVNDLCFFRIKRVPADGSDTLAADARLIGIRVFFTTNAADDT
jgi:hypothetical protein